MQETKNVMDNNEKPTEKTKRKSERQITKDDTVSSDEEHCDDGTFEKASEEVLKSRKKVYRVRREEPLGTKASTAQNPFAAVTLTKAGNEPGSTPQSTTPNNEIQTIDQIGNIEKVVEYQEEKKDADQGPVVQGEKQTAPRQSGFASVFGSKAVGGFGSLAATATRGNGANGLAFGKPSTVVEAEDASNTEQKAVFGTSGKSQNAQDKETNEIETGEEGEENVFSCNATLFVFESKQWKERGKGLLKINLGRDKKGARVIMRQQGNLKLLLNANLWDKMKVSKMEGTTGITFACFNHLSDTTSNENLQNQEECLSTFAIRTRESSTINDLYEAFMMYKQNTGDIHNQ